MSEREFTAKTLDWLTDGGVLIARYVMDDGLIIKIHCGAHHKRLHDDKFPPETDVEAPCA